VSFTYHENNGPWPSNTTIPLSVNSNVATATIAVTSRHTITAVTLTPASPIYGDPLAFTATISKISPSVPDSLGGSGTAAATVQFKIDGNNLGAPKPVSSGGI